MAIVGAISIVGAIPYARSKQVDWRSVWLFGLPAMIGTFISAWLGEHGLSVDWATIGLFIAIGLGGCFVGQRLNARLNQRVLKQVFAVFLILIGAFVIVKESGKLLQFPPRESVSAVAVKSTSSIPYMHFCSDDC
jgi:uncharacterized membrane protein YfcA